MMEVTLSSIEYRDGDAIAVFVPMRIGSAACDYIVARVKKACPGAGEVIVLDAGMTCAVIKRRLAPPTPAPRPPTPDPCPLVSGEWVVDSGQ
jgi:hypothetical protein